MNIDNNLIFSGSLTQTAGSPASWTGQSLVGAAGNYLSTNYMDLDPTGTHSAGNFPDLGQGQEMHFWFWVPVAMAGATSVTFQVVQADDAAFSTNLEVLNQSAAIAIAKLTVGSFVFLHWPITGPYTQRRYVGLRYVTAGANMTAGTVVAGVTMDKQDVANLFGRSGFTVT